MRILLLMLSLMLNVFGSDLKDQTEISTYKSLPSVQQPTFRILSLAGSGTGMSEQLLFMKELEKAIGKSMSDCFHMIAGTSSGSVLALGLTMSDKDSIKPTPKYNVSDIFDYINKNIKSFFNKNWFSFGGFLRTIYNDQSLEKNLLRLTGDSKLSETTTGCLVTVIDAKTMEPKVLCKFPSEIKHKPLDNEESDFLRFDLARAGTAIPTLFSPHLVQSTDGKKTFLGIDGALAMNDPSVDAAVRAHYLLKDKNTPIEIVTIYRKSLYECREPISEIKKKGFWWWLKKTTSYFMQSDMMQGFQTLKFLNVKRSFWAPNIPKKYGATIDTSKETQMIIQQAMAEHIDARKIEFQELVAFLKMDKTDTQLLMADN